MHIFEALIKDHETVKSLLEELINLDENDKESRKDLVQEIRDELVPHARAEESLFYNSLRTLISDENGAEKDKVMHGFKEHMEAEALLRALQVEDMVNMGWKTTAKKLKAALEHHIHEEENEIFAVARKLISQEEANVLGDLFEKIKPQIQEEGFMKNSLEMMMNLLPPRVSDAVKKARTASQGERKAS